MKTHRAAMEELDRVEEGQILIVDGNRKLTVSRQLAARFRKGDRLFADLYAGDLLHVPASDHELARRSVDRAIAAWRELKASSAEQRRSFFRIAAEGLRNGESWDRIQVANQADVAVARSKGRPTGRVVLDESVRASMIDGLLAWAERVAPPSVPLESHRNPRGRVQLFRTSLGVVGFVFEGRPNVLVDACGCISTGNAAVLRIGSDAITTARTCMAEVIEPALLRSGLPEGTVSLLDATSHAAAWALFSDERLALAVVRGSGRATQVLGSIAKQAGTPISMHGTGGAWIFASSSTDPEELKRAVVASLDRKVCNTMNTCCITRESAERLAPALVDGLREAGAKRGCGFGLHALHGAESLLPPTDPARERIETIEADELGREWEWDQIPEVTFLVVSTLAEGVRLFNEHSPRFVASLLSSDASEQQEFFDTIEAPFVGDGYTRWVDGQFALGRPELGLSNWEYGRLFGRGGILSGDDIFTIRARFEGSRTTSGDTPGSS